MVPDGGLKTSPVLDKVPLNSIHRDVELPCAGFTGAAAGRILSRPLPRILFDRLHLHGKQY